MIKKITSFFFLKVCILTLVISHNSIGGNLNTGINGKLQRAKELYNQRENVERLKSAIDLYENILEQLPKRKETFNKKRTKVLVELSKCYYKMAVYHAKNNREKVAWFKLGEKHGREAILLDTENVGGYYWMAQNLGELGGINKLYFLNKRNDFEKALIKAETLDNPQDPYDYAGIYRILTAYNTPRYLWGNLEKALEYARKMENSSRYLSNLSVLADLYWKVDKTIAKDYAKRVIDADLSQFPETQFENALEQKEVVDKWSKLLKDTRQM